MLFHFLFFLIYIGQQTQCSNIIDNNAIKANQTNAKSNSIKNINKKPKENPLLDATTALFHHVENTKTCGNNLQKLSIDLEPLWSFKFISQIKKATRLANSINYIISNVNEDSISSSNYKNAYSNSKNNDLLNSNLIESNLLSSLSHFIFSQTTNDLQESSTAPIAPLSSDLFQSSSEKEDALYNNNKNNDDKDKYNLNDPYIMGYGVILFLDNDNPTCLYISKSNGNAKDNLSNEKFLKNRSCSSLNYRNEGASSEDVFETKNEINENIILNDSKFFSGGNEIFDDSLQNCLNWYKNLKASYDEFSNANAKKYEPLGYFQYLQKLLDSKNFTSSLWCGPYYECTLNDKKDDKDWILIYSLPLFDKAKVLKGALTLKLKLTKLDINQCENGDPVFANTHKCKPNSNCLFTPTKSFKSGNYKCKCQTGFINSNGTLSSYDGTSLESQYWLMKSMKNNSYYNNFNCLPCLRNECCNLDLNLIDKNLLNMNDEESVKEFVSHSSLFWSCRTYNTTLRLVILIIQFIFIVLTISLAVIIFISRNNKIIKHSMWILLEMILFGALLLYSTLVIQYLEPSTNSCLAIPWFRELGFTIVYGILNLRLYKILVEFQSRKAHCVQLKDKDILRILSFIVVCVLGYLTAWTLVDLDYASEGFSLLTNTSLKGLIQYPICKIKWWDYFIEIAEFLFICVGFYLLYCTRTAPSEFNERKFISLVIYFEGFVSTLLNVIKHSIYSSIHPDTILILYFFRCHTTVTIMLLFIFMTKLCFLFKPNTEEYCRNSRLSTVEGHDAHPGSDSVKFQIGHGVNNVEFEVGELNITDMEPEEIRSELKRLYTQLHVFKTKSAKTDNPHIQSKRRGNNKKNRRLSINLPKSHQKDNESYQIKTPDESICSNEVNMQHSLACSEDKDPMNHSSNKLAI